MLINNNIIITNKTKYFIILITNLLKKYIIGLKINPNQIYIYIKSINLAYILTFLKFNMILNFNNLVDIVVSDNIFNKNRFEISYIF
jgi:hypothetical protein